MSLVTFITATIGRESLLDTQASIEEQTDTGWQWIAAGDGVDPPIAERHAGWPLADQERALRLPQRHHESPTRNDAVALADTPFVAFVDDDDTISPHYVEWLREATESATNDVDVVIFRQTFPLEAGGVAIFPHMPEIVWGNVGISYAVRRELAMAHPFKESRHEDLLQLVAFEAAGAEIVFSPHVAYFGRGVEA